MLSTIINGKTGSNRDHIGRGEKSLGLELHQLAMRDGASLPVPGLRDGRAGMSCDDWPWWNGPLSDAL